MDCGPGNIVKECASSNASGAVAATLVLVAVVVLVVVTVVAAAEVVGMTIPFVVLIEFSDECLTNEFSTPLIVVVFPFHVHDQLAIVASAIWFVPFPIAIEHSLSSLGPHPLSGPLDKTNPQKIIYP